MHSSNRGGAMYSQGAFHIVVLLLVVLVGPAVAQQLTGSQLLVTGSGPHAIGQSVDPGYQLTLGGTFTGAGTTGGLQLAGFYNAGVNQVVSILNVGGYIY